MKKTAKPRLPRLDAITIERTGQVEFHVTGDHHCGPAAEIRQTADGRQAMPVRYRVVVQCAPRLDDRGFLFDQVTVDLWMRRQAALTTDLSCEALAVHLGEEMLVKMQRDVPHCRVQCLELTLSPAPFAALVKATFRTGR